ncbi:MAG: redoxin family protein [Dehalococcoidales bacterium]
MGKILKIMTALMLVIVFTLGLGLAGCSSAGTAPEVGKLAPDFQLSNLEGQSVSLSDFRGQPVLVNFWASWCGPCRYEMPFLQQIHEEQAANGLVVLGINLGESPGEVREFMGEFGLTFTTLLDSEQDVALMYNVRSIPTTLLIDENGVIQGRKVGAFTTMKELETVLGKIM